MNRLRSATRLLRFLIAALLWLLIAVGVVLRLTVRDRYYPIGLVYYMTPVPALALYSIVAMLLWPRAIKTDDAAQEAIPPTRRFSLRRFHQLVILVLLGWMIGSEFQSRTTAASPTATKVLFWNVSHVQMGIPRLGTEIRSRGASIVGLVESDRAFRTVAEEWERELSGYEVAHSEFGGLIAVKGRIKAHQYHSLGYHSYCEQFDLNVDDADVTVLLVDIASNPRLSRARAILSLKSVAESLADRAVIIMGDFNTPDDSVWLDTYRPTFQNAFAARGPAMRRPGRCPCRSSRLTKSGRMNA